MLNIPLINLLQTNLLTVKFIIELELRCHKLIKLKKFILE